MTQYHVDLKLLLYVTIAYGIDRILSKTKNYKMFRRIIIILAIIAAIFSAKYNENTITNATLVILIGYGFDYYKEFKKDNKPIK